MPLHTTARFWLRLARGPLAAASAYATCSFTSCAAWPPTAPIQAKNTSVPDKSWRPGWQLALEYRIELGRELGSGGFGQVQQTFPSPALPTLTHPVVRQVFLAINTKTGISRAVKRVRRDNLESDKALLREFEVTSRPPPARPQLVPMTAPPLLLYLCCCSNGNIPCQSNTLVLSPASNHCPSSQPLSPLSEM